MADKVTLYWTSQGLRLHTHDVSVVFYEVAKNYITLRLVMSRRQVGIGRRDIALVKLDLAKLTSRDQPPVYKGLLPTTPFLSLAYSLSYNDW